MLFREALYYQNIIALEEGGELIAKSYQSLHHEHTNHPHQFAGSWVVLGAGSQTHCFAGSLGAGGTGSQTHWLMLLLGFPLLNSTFLPPMYC